MQRFSSIFATRALIGWLLVAALVGAPVAACTPTIVPAGPVIEQAHLTADSIVTADGVSLPLHHWLPANGKPRAVILALHGFNDYGNAFAAPGAWWADRGIATYAYDQRGFGATTTAGFWPGTQSLVDDLRTAADLLRARYPDTPLYLLGESMGAAVILAAAGEGGVAADGLILTAPAVRARETMNPFYRVALWAGAHFFPWAELTGRGLKIQATDNISVIRGLQRDPLVIKKTRIDAIWGLVNLMDAALASAPQLRRPALLVYGAKDEVVPREPAAALVARVDSAIPVAVYDSGWHMVLRDLKANIVLGDIAAWIADPDLETLPSGAVRVGDAFFDRTPYRRLVEAGDKANGPALDQHAMFTPAAKP